MKNICLMAILALTLCVGLVFGSCDRGDDDDDSGDSPFVDDDMDDDSHDDDTDDVDDDADDDSADDDDIFDPTDHVDPFIGTAIDHGQLSPAASVPFGMVRLGPDTLIRSHSGYEFAVANTTGFSHTRIDGVGSKGAGGNLKILPGLGERTGFALWMGKKTELAQPGYYAVELGADRKILAEMTATEHVGLHRYEFRTDATPHLFINFNDPFTDWIGSEWEANDASDEISGWVAAENVCGHGRYQFYFSIQFSRPFTDLREISSPRGGTNARLDFSTRRGEALLVKVGLSSVSEDEARTDRDIEVPDWDFDRVREEARQTWRKHLGVVDVEGAAGEEDLVTLFYTMLYRASHTPVNITTHSGKYRGTDGEVHEAINYRRHHCWSLWDTYRNKFALHNLLYAERSGEIMQSLVDFYIEGKVDWSTDFEPYPNVRTEHAPALLLDAHRKGIGGFDFAPAFDAILAETHPGGSPDRELEGSFDRWAIAHLAQILGEEDVYDEYIALSALYRETWVEHFRDMGPDADLIGAQGMYEGTLWQYRWAVVHDLPGIIDLDGGPEVFQGKLTQFFDEELYTAGNETDLQAPFLFNYAGAPWRTQDIVRTLLSEPINQWYGTHEKWPIPAHRPVYLAKPVGFIMNMDDDAGTMSSWFVLAALGLYPVTVGQPVYALTAPLFARAVLRLAGGDFTILAADVSSENRFIQSATLNDEDLPRAWLWHDEVASGGELVFEMGPQPNEQWGAAADQAPPGAFE